MAAVKDERIPNLPLGISCGDRFAKNVVSKRICYYLTVDRKFRSVIHGCAHKAVLSYVVK